MKTKIFVCLVFGFLLSLTGLHAQTSKGFNYKTIVTDNSGNPYRNYFIDFKITLKEGNTVIWQEQHDDINSGPYGICTLVIGEGTRIGGTYSNFEDIEWFHNSNYTISVDIKVGGSSTWDTIVTDEPFQAVPLAKSAEILQPTAGGIHLYSHALKPYMVSSSKQGIWLDGTNNEDWYIYMDDNNDIRVVNDLSLTMKLHHDTDLVHFYGDIQLEGEINTGSDDADMKPYIYGYVNSNGNVQASSSTSGFTVTKTGTGIYEISFSNNINSDEYIVLTTSNASFINCGVNKQNNQFTVYTRRVSSNSLEDASFNFVVFKK